MPRRTNTLWSEEECIVVLSLYCQIPFGKFDKTNPLVIATGELIGRTPSSVALKLVNFASLDPYHQKRGVSGMCNVSKLDRQVWAEFYGQWDKLSDSFIATELVSGDSKRFKSPPLSTTMDRETETTEIRTVRRGQAFFRNSVLAAHNFQCCITGIQCPDLLRASHIIPWSVSSITRLDPTNGLCLNTLHDAAFDRGLMTLADDFTLTLSSTLQEMMPSSVYTEYFDKYARCPIQLPDRFTPDPQYLDYHRTHIYRS